MKAILASVLILFKSQTRLFANEDPPDAKAEAWKARKKELTKDADAKATAANVATAGARSNAQVQAPDHLKAALAHHEAANAADQVAAESKQNGDNDDAADYTGRSIAHKAMGQWHGGQANPTQLDPKTKQPIQSGQTRANEKLLNDLQSDVQRLIAADSRFKSFSIDGAVKGNAWVRDVCMPTAPDESWYAVVSAQNGKLYRVDFTLADDKPTLSMSTPVEVEIDTRYEPVANEGTSEGATKGHQTKRTTKAYAASANAHMSSRDAHTSDDEEQHGAAVAAHESAADAHRLAGKMDMAKMHEQIADIHRAHMDNPPPDDDGDEDDKPAEVDATANEIENDIDPQPVLANEGQQDQAILFVNETKAEGNWVMISPYGDWPHSGGIQRFQKSDAEAVVQDFKRLANIGTRIVGLPWYIGHPDHPAFKEQYKDGRAYGRIKELQAREDGLWGNVKWNTAGKQMVNEEMFHGHSVNWRVKKDKEGFYHPISVQSVGFTNQPNIPVPPITQANERRIIDEVENDLVSA